MITKKVNKMPKTKASKRIELRVTDEFFQDLYSKIEDSGLAKADYFRHILSQGKVVVKRDYNSLATQVRKVGINLNEVAFVLNVANKKNALNMYDFQELLLELKLIHNQLNRIGA